MKKVLTLICLITLTLTSSTLATEVSAASLSGYRCLNSTCGSYLEQKNVWDQTHCPYCDTAYDSYKCNACGNWYAICRNGHYLETKG